ncbi:NBR1-Ig-like domain-containing protein [Actinocorallia populi]|uniref:NBR1-Ig-like domain-containing protein n=1 Tax=Actinocorallia populi TaxID=2079200 RepID=UPI001E34D763|nr:NBR1-Ig-like domain-containing protein [Actinocorallia populi]
MRARAETIKDFAAALRELRDSVGNPSFREMSGRSGAISHTTLHEATKGNRLPSWETTVEFVKACGADPAAYRERWERANLPVRSTRAWSPEERAGVPAAGPPGELAFSSAGEAEHHGARAAGESRTPPPAGEASAPAASPPPPPDEIVSDVEPALPVPGNRRRRRLAVPAAAVLATAAVAVGTAVAVERRPESPPRTPAAPSQTPTEPRIPGDISQFLADVTIPDGTVVSPGERFVKTWEILNAGTVTWRGRFLARGAYPADNGTCETPAKVPVPVTKPGEKVRVSVPATAPSTPGSCWVGWKMVDGEGIPFLPGARPIFFVVHVRN